MIMGSTDFEKGGDFWFLGLGSWERIMLKNDPVQVVVFPWSGQQDWNIY